ncbi:MAG: hypothetical protein HGA72_04415, partial [Chlorobiaceae bacterium]|nr:hypothetical protein [Chlorobiaceae bacterium]
LRRFRRAAVRTEPPTGRRRRRDHRRRLLHFRLVQPGRWDPPPALQAPPWNLSRTEAWDQLVVLLSTLRQQGAVTGPAGAFTTFEEFWEAYAQQTRYIIRKSVDLYERTESIRARFFQTPYLSCLVKGCAEKGLDITQGGPELWYGTIEAVTYATTVDSLLAIKYLVFDKKICRIDELVVALQANWEGYEVLRAQALNKAPKYGRDDDEADAMGRKVMDLP